MAGVELNAFPLAFRGELELWRAPARKGEAVRDAMRRLRAELRYHNGAFWAARRLDDGEAEQHRLRADASPAVLLLFAFREALAHRLRGMGTDVWFGAAQVIRCVGLLPAQRVDAFDVQPELRLMVTNQHFGEGLPVILAQRRSRWTCAKTLADSDLRAVAPGQNAVRVSGDGPPRGRVESAGDSQSILLTKNERVAVPSSAYTLSATTAMVARLGGSDVLSRVKEAAGMTMPSGKPNTYAVRDRFCDAAEMLEQLGGVVTLPGGQGEGRIAGSRLQVRIERP